MAQRLVGFGEAYGDVLEDEVALRALLDADLAVMAGDTEAFEVAVEIMQEVIDGEEFKRSLGEFKRSWKRPRTRMSVPSGERYKVEQRCGCLQQFRVRHCPYTWLMRRHAFSLSPRRQTS